MKRTFEIEWGDDLGPMWMNQDNLMSCLNGEQHCGTGLIKTVRDVTPEPRTKPAPEEEQPVLK